MDRELLNVHSLQPSTALQKQEFYPTIIYPGQTELTCSEHQSILWADQIREDE